MSEWIRVDEMPPEESQKVKIESNSYMQWCTVIAYGVDQYGLKSVRETRRTCRWETGIDCFDSPVKEKGKEFDKWYWSDLWKEVTHWMPLPEPPEVNE